MLCSVHKYVHFKRCGVRVLALFFQLKSIFFRSFVQFLVFGRFIWTLCHSHTHTLTNAHTIISSIFRPTRFFGTARWFAMKKGEYITDKANRPHSVSQPPQTWHTNQSINAKKGKSQRWHIFRIVNKPSESRFRSNKWTSSQGGLFNGVFTSLQKTTGQQTAFHTPFVG